MDGCPLTRTLGCCACEVCMVSRAVLGFALGILCATIQHHITVSISYLPTFKIPNPGDFGPTPMKAPEQSGNIPELMRTPIFGVRIA